MDILSLVPEEVSEIILSYLPFKDLATAASVSRKWRQICDSLNQHGMRCCVHKKFRDQPVVSDFSGEESGCRWIELYHASRQRARNWISNEFWTFHIKNTIVVHGFVVFLGNERSLTVNRVKNGELDIIQTIDVPIAITRISFSSDTLVFGNDRYLYIYKLHRTYEREAILHPIKGTLVSQAKNVIPSKLIIYYISVITKNHIWIKIKMISTISKNVTYNEKHVCKVYNRDDTTFFDIPFDYSLCEIRNNDEYVSILLWNSIRVYKTSGELIKTLDSS